MTRRGWNYADVLEAVADRFPLAPAAIHADMTLSWRQFDERADGLARTLLAAGLGRQDKVAQYLRNCPQYLESMFASFKVAMVPVNTNFRYGDDELAYLWSDSDTAAVVFGSEFTDNMRPAAQASAPDPPLDTSRRSRRLPRLGNPLRDRGRRQSCRGRRG